MVYNLKPSQGASAFKRPKGNPDRSISKFKPKSTGETARSAAASKMLSRYGRKESV